MNKPLATKHADKTTSVLEAEMQRLYDKHKKLDAEIVLREASKPSSPLHHRFEWDDTEAARRYRLQQANDLIVQYQITIRPIPQVELRVPRFFSTARARREGLGYAPREKIRLSDARETGDAEIAGWQVRFLNLLDICGQGERSEEAKELFEQLKSLLW